MKIIINLFLLMKFTLALVGAAAATTETGIKMLQKLNTMDQSIENMENVKVALVTCAAAGDCSQEAAAMPTLAMEATTDTTTPATTTTADDSSTETALQKWKHCYKTAGANAHAADVCAKEKVAAFNKNEVAYLTAKVEATCVTRKATLSGVTDGKLATDATNDDKEAYAKWDVDCKFDTAALAAAKDGAMPWIIVGGIVGVVCIVGAICYCQKNKASEDN